MFHRANPSLFGRPDSVVRGSRALRSTASELREACASSSEGEPQAFLRTFRLLSDFSRQLSSYFDATTSANHFDAISEDCPSLASRARDVEWGHEELRASFAVTTTPGPGLATMCTLGFSRHVADLLDRFEEHEHSERRLLQDFFLRTGETECSAT